MKENKRAFPVNERSNAETTFKIFPVQRTNVGFALIPLKGLLT
jgi:hypothetical protein